MSPALEYEGVVQGEADDNQVQSQSGGYFANEVKAIHCRVILVIISRLNLTSPYKPLA